MRAWLSKLEAMAAAVAFAEEADWKMAEAIMGQADMDRARALDQAAKRMDQRQRKQSYRV